MAEQSKIQWTTHTFNLWRGCQKIAEGCRNCYAETLSKRNPGTLGIWGSESSGATRVVAAESYWQGPVRWNGDAERDHGQACRAWELAEKYGKPGGSIPHARPRVFCASLADVFEDWQGPMVNASGNQIHACRKSLLSEAWVVEGEHRASCVACHEPLTMNDVRARLFQLIDATPNLDWLLLTKRPENVRRMWPIPEWNACLSGDCPHDTQAECDRSLADPEVNRRDNVWLGVSCSTQDDCDRMIPELLKCRDLAAKLFVSLEPLIEPVDLSLVEVEVGSAKGGYPAFPLIDWVIVGGESGTAARPCNVEWIRDVVQQCKAAGVPCFVKQLGSRLVITGDQHPGWPGQYDESTDEWRANFTDPKGGDPAEWPEDLRVREVPK